MEVHAHTHPAHGGTGTKKWTHYFWEFLMLFLAVFCGFLAENQREHLVEHQREKQYIKSFYEDLTADEKDLQIIINRLEHQVIIADSLERLMNNVSERTPANLIYVYLRSITRSSGTLLNVNDRTVIQLRNAGGMRLIQNKNVSDSIVSYYKDVETINFLNEESHIIKTSLREKYQAILNAADFAKVIDSTNAVTNPSDILYLRSADENAINNCLMEVNSIKGLNNGLKMRIQRLKDRAGRIKKFIAKEYNLQ